MNFKWGSVAEIAIIIWLMTETDLRPTLTSKKGFFVTSANG